MKSYSMKILVFSINNFSFKRIMIMSSSWKILFYECFPTDLFCVSYQTTMNLWNRKNSFFSILKHIFRSEHVTFSLYWTDLMCLMKYYLFCMRMKLSLSIPSFHTSVLMYHTGRLWVLHFSNLFLLALLRQTWHFMLPLPTFKFDVNSIFKPLSRDYRSRVGKDSRCPLLAR